MAYRIGWYIEGQVIYSELWGTQSHEDATRANAELLRHLEAGTPGATHVLVDGSKLTRAPISVESIGNTLTGFRHPNVGWMIGLGKSGHLSGLLARLTVIVFRLRFQHHDTLDEALAFLREIDPELRWETADSSVFDDPAVGTK